MRPLRARAWWLMRQEVEFELADLLATLSDGSERNAAKNLREYLRALRHAQVVVRVRGRVFRLAADLGPQVPVERRDTKEPGLWDPNAGRLIARGRKGAACGEGHHG